MRAKTHRGRRARVLTGLAALLLRAAAADAAELWPGPNNACSPDTLLGDWGGLRPRLAEYGLGFGLQNQTEGWANFFGGLARGAAYDGLLTASLCVDLDKALAWQGATVFASGFQVSGPGPTPTLVGALQLVSSIEATPSTKLYDLWFEQQLLAGKLSFRFGQEGANDEFMLADYAALFLNSSFTYPPNLALDIPAGGPNYPLAVPFVRLKLTPGDQWALQGGIYTEDPAPPGPGNPQLRDRHGTAFQLDDHALSFTELWFMPGFLKDRDRPGTYKLGFWYATGTFADQERAVGGLPLANPASGGIPAADSGDWGVYAIVNQMLWRKPKTESQGIGAFVQVMHSPSDRNPSDLFVAGGLVWNGPVPGRALDQAGLALTYADVSAAARRFRRELIFFTAVGSPLAAGEPILEATYLLQVTPGFTLQPDLQYVINPGAGIPSRQSSGPLKNALVAGVRVTVNF